MEVPLMLVEMWKKISPKGHNFNALAQILFRGKRLISREILTSLSVSLYSCCSKGNF